ncbi:MAG: citramalate synthase [Haloarculaceae archaeon]
MELCDVTLREGAQMPGRDYSIEQRVEAGRAIDRLGVAAIQAGFPVVGEAHVEAVRRLAPVTDADVTALARARPADVDAAVDAGADVVSLFAPLSDVMLEHVFGKDREEAFGMLEEGVVRADDAGVPVRIGLMDGFRTDAEHVIEAAERFPGYTLGLADTVGNRTPDFVTSFLDELDAGGVDLSRIGVHFHDDLGVATANTLAADRAGVGSADVSVAALGERAGNTPIEQLVVAGSLEREEAFGVDAEVLVPACLDALDALDEDVDPRRPVLGEEVVRHESGLHTAVMLDHPFVFEPFDPADFGGQRELVFGAITGRGAARKLVERVGREPTDERIGVLLERLGTEGPMGLDGALDLARSVEA